MRIKASRQPKTSFHMIALHQKRVFRRWSMVPKQMPETDRESDVARQAGLNRHFIAV